MKYIFVFLTFVLSLNSIAQSKKEQIAILTARLDSLNKEYIKDTTYLSNTIETVDREYSIISMQYDEAKDQLKKKSATITDKSNTIKSLNTKNMELMEASKKLYQKIQELEFKIKSLKVATVQQLTLFTLANSNVDIAMWQLYEDDEETWRDDYPNVAFSAKYKPTLDVGLNIDGSVFIFDSNVKGTVTRCNEIGIESQLFKSTSGYSCDSILNVYWGGNGDYLYSIKKIENQIIILKEELGEYSSMPITLWQVKKDISSGVYYSVMQFKGKLWNYIGEPDIDVEFECEYGDCNYLGYIQNEIDNIKNRMKEYDE